MEIIELPTKAFAYSRKILPAEKNQKFFYATQVKTKSHTEQDDKQKNYKRKEKRKTSKKSSFIIGVLLAFIVCFSVCSFTFPFVEIREKVLDVVEKLFEPRDFGKIKFASGEIEEEKIGEEAFSSLSSFDMPFASCVAKNVGDVFLLTSAGEITVKCAMDGVVESIETHPNTFKKTIKINHAHGLKSEYSMIDSVSVKVGDKVLKNTIIGITENGEIGLKINWNNKVIKGLDIIDGQLSFV